MSILQISPLSLATYLLSIKDYVSRGSQIRARGGGLRITHPPKSDFLTVLELNQILDLNFDASELDFGPSRTSKKYTFLIQKSTFSEKADLHDLLIFSIQNQHFASSESSWSVKKAIWNRNDFSWLSSIDSGPILVHFGNQKSPKNHQNDVTYI